MNTLDADTSGLHEFRTATTRPEQCRAARIAEDDAPGLCRTSARIALLALNADPAQPCA
ncbi:hypothetical protein [Nocardia wallacei]|uniref:hypothetical protein n=1 Tax=Nocardia wallacei TaxID=480035 RepID=UPI002458C1D9|nr:hypothetical protein [Nocardia wallacei]